MVCAVAWGLVGRNGYIALGRVHGYTRLNLARIRETVH